VTRDELVSYCLGKPGAFADYPWGEDDLVVKVGIAPEGKVFAFLGSDDGFGRDPHGDPSASPGGVALKCEPDLVDELRAAYPQDVSTAPYLAKRQWNLVRLGGAVPDDEIRELVDRSHALVAKSLVKRLRPAETSST
jgi:predicted DNA-binding protein (MmcQ/YjbR family)